MAYPLSFSATESSFTPSTQILNLQTNQRNQVTTVGVLNNFGNLVGVPFGCDVTNLSVTASANATDNEVFTVVTSSGFNTAYTNTAVMCTILSATSSCSFSGLVSVAANSRIGISQLIPSGTPAGWSVTGGMICK